MRSSFRSSRLRAIAFACACLVAAPVDAARPKLPPVDQCRTEGLPQFRDALARIVRKRDGKALMAIVSSDVQIGFDGDNGKAAFAKVWHPDDRNSELWRLMERMLALGCAGSGPTRLIPSLGEQLNDDDDAFEVLLVSVPSARLRETSTDDARTVATLGWDVVRMIERDELQAKVKLEDGREGWLWDSQVYAPIDYRMVLEKAAGRWMIVAFVAGD
jgi:hypothetical protein